MSVFRSIGVCVCMCVCVVLCGSDLAANSKSFEVFLYDLVVLFYTISFDARSADFVTREPSVVE